MDSERQPFLKGMIILWHWNIASIPAGWTLCNGENGTPDLTDRFVVQAGGIYGALAEGGSFSHSHDFTGTGHDHNLPVGTGVSAGSDFNAQSAVNVAEGLTESEEHLPPYFALVYMMKL